ncbi:hypothetical protein BD560DRAFT_422368 [Blakeslea trispora]|nr:hypothetical protein BD560DRAFT_422368 [Blakeslea trispora]
MKMKLLWNVFSTTAEWDATTPPYTFNDCSGNTQNSLDEFALCVYIGNKVEVCSSHNLLKNIKILNKFGCRRAARFTLVQRKKKRQKQTLKLALVKLVADMSLQIEFAFALFIGTAPIAEVSLFDYAIPRFKFT